MKWKARLPCLLLYLKALELKDTRDLDTLAIGSVNCPPKRGRQSSPKVIHKINIFQKIISFCPIKQLRWMMRYQIPIPCGASTQDKAINVGDVPSIVFTF